MKRLRYRHRNSRQRARVTICCSAKNMKKGPVEIHIYREQGLIALSVTRSEASAIRKLIGSWIDGELSQCNAVFDLPPEITDVIVTKLVKNGTDQTPIIV